jgi:uncharacterized protein
MGHAIILGGNKSQGLPAVSAKESAMNANDIYDLGVRQFTRTLRALKGCLAKAAAHADQKKFDVNKFFDMRMAPDQFPLSRQIQAAADTARGYCARLSGQTMPSIEDNEKTLAEFYERIDKTIAYLATFKPMDFEGWEKRMISFKFYPGKELTAPDYVVTHALPNFYFHTAMAYAILRENGVEVGKSDFLGDQPWRNV